MAASPSDTSSPLLQPWGLNQSDDDVRPGTALMDARIRELQREQGYTRFFFQPDDDADDALAQKARGDTLVQVLFPGSSHVRCDGTIWSHVQFRMSANLILATGSAVFRKKLAKVTPEMRMRRQQDRTVPLLPEDVEYIVDLTPPDMDEESAALVSILSVPESVRSWWQSGLRLHIKRTLVCGHDDACPDHRNVPNDCERLPGLPGAANEHHHQDTLPVLDLEDIVGPVPSRQIPDYCPIRHRANIIFLMEAIMSGSTASIVDMLDSATRVYTLVKLAKALDCIGVIRDPVFAWALAHPNGNFIELLPEVSLELFWDLGVYAAVRSTFSILVVEGAMELLGLPADSIASATSSATTERAGSTTIFGRKRDRLPDDISNAIQHARDNVTERTRALAGQLKSDSIYDLLSQDDLAGMSIPEWDHLSSIGETLGCTVPGRSAHTAMDSSLPVVTARSKDQQLLDELKTAYEELAYSLVAYFHTQIAEALSFTDFDFHQTDRNRMCYVPRSQFTSTATIYKRLNEEQRLLTTYPWERLKTKAKLNSLVNFFFLPVSTNTLAQLSMWLDAILEDSKHIFPELAPYRREYPDGDNGQAFFRLDAFRTQYAAALDSLRQRRAIHGLEDYEFLRRSQHLALGLSENELRYLPMWAGGCDDGMGGVYESHMIPNSDNGPSGPGPAFHTDLSVPSEVSSIAPSTPTVGGTTTTDDDATETAGRSLLADVSSSSSRSTANIYSSQNASIWESPDFMAESEESDAFDFADSDSDNFPLD